MEGLLFWQQLLRPADIHVTVYTDSLAAKYMLTNDKQPSEMRAKLVAKFSEFSGATITHLSADKNQVADFLSRYCEKAADSSSDSEVDINIQRRVRVSNRAKCNSDNLPDGPLPEDRIIYKLIDYISRNNGKGNIENSRIAMVGHIAPLMATDDNSTDENAGAEKDNSQEQKDNETHKNMLHVALEDHKVKEQLMTQQKLCSYTGPIVQLWSRGSFEKIINAFQIEKVIYGGSQEISDSARVVIYATTSG